MKKLYSSDDHVELQLLKSKLAEEGIICFLKNEAPPAAGEIPPVMAQPELWVIEDQDYAKAMTILQSEMKRLREPRTAWRCPQCGERLEGQFDVCWKCGHSRT
ncbi:MAG: hypothetical protein A3F41_02250 [Coxiella sp. RIFCSPHIGHO2_12_FULL_44_14]|nr:MAG: hypothetical protein A3F41_02250 [Coxiella sp. RIFCSPHIGHO2_12_FULL_44_14]